MERRGLQMVFKKQTSLNNKVLTSKKHMLVNKISVFVSLIIFLSFILTGCTPKVNAREEAEEAVADVIECINKRDSEGLIALFCEDVKDNYELTSEVDTLFNIFDSEITSYEVSAVSSGNKSELFGESYYCITAIVAAYVDDKEYRIEVSKTIYDEQKPQRVGMTTVMGMDENVKEMFFVGEVNVLTSSADSFS